jgi:hypothetical protein
VGDGDLSIALFLREIGCAISETDDQEASATRRPAPAPRAFHTAPPAAPPLDAAIASGAGPMWRRAWLALRADAGGQ